MTMLLRKGPSSRVLGVPSTLPTSPTTHPLNGWELWRDDQFDGSTGTVYNKWMWGQTDDYSGKGISSSNILQLSPNGMRMRARFVDDGGGGVTGDSAELASGPHWYRRDQFNRYGHHYHFQSFFAPFMISARCRATMNGLNLRMGTWCHQPMTTMDLFGGGFPTDPNSRFGMETDGDEYQLSWGSHTMAYHLTPQNTAAISQASWFNTLSPPIDGEWYDLIYVFDTDARPGGMKTITTYINDEIRQRSRNDWGSQYYPYLDHVWDNVPHNVTLMNWAGYNNESTPSSGYGYYDIQEFRVWLPPGDPRLSDLFRSNHPDWIGSTFSAWPPS
jgi:hypothetical protein